MEDMDKAMKFTGLEASCVDSIICDIMMSITVVFIRSQMSICVFIYQ